MEQQIECSTCNWNKHCISPPTMTKEEVEEKIQKKHSDKPESDLMGGMLATLFFSGKDTDCVACPAFIKKLSESPDLANKIKEWMQSS